MFINFVESEPLRGLSIRDEYADILRQGFWEVEWLRVIRGPPAYEV
jgi:hypothetical protein